MMHWSNGQRFRDVLSRGRCMSVVGDHQAGKIGRNLEPYPRGPSYLGV